MPAQQAWPRVPMGSVYAGLYDGPHATPKPSDKGPVFLGIGNITEDGHLDLSTVRHIAEDDFSSWTRRVQPRAGDIVFAYEAALNRYAIIPDGFLGCLGRRLALIRPDPLKTDGRFLFYYFFSEDWRRTIARNTLSGATVDRIPLTRFPQFEISQPPLVTQRRIADILSAYDDLIENNSRRIAILEEMARSLYREWFVNFRFPGHEDVEMIGSPIGAIPACFEPGRLDQAVELQRGFDLPTGQRELGKVPIYASTGVVGFHSVTKVNGPGVITGRSGSLGTVLYADRDFWPLNTTLWVREFRRSSPLHAFHLLSLLDFAGFNSGAAVPTLNRNDVHGLPLALPPITLIARFDEMVQPFFSLIGNLTQRNNVLRQTRDLLLPRLISGELSLEVAEEELAAVGS